MPVSSTATVTPWPVSPVKARRVAPVCGKNASDGACGPVDSVADCALTGTSGVTVMPGNAASTGSRAMGIEASTPLMRWYCVKTVPPTSSTAATGVKSPVEVTMTVSVVLADAAGTPATDVPANAATTAAPKAAIRFFFHQTGLAG